MGWEQFAAEMREVEALWQEQRLIQAQARQFRQEFVYLTEAWDGGSRFGGVHCLCVTPAPFCGIAWWNLYE